MSDKNHNHNHTHVSRISLPSCRNYWRLQEAEPMYSNSSPSAQPQLHQLNYANNTKSILLMHPNPNQKYHKRRDLPDGGNPTLRYRIREPLSPFRGVARLVFWILFALILIIIGALVITAFYLGRSSNKAVGEGAGSIILNALFNKKHF